MSRIELEALNFSELRAYVVAHPKDTEAFHLWVDRATANAPQTWYPAPKTEEDFAEMERIMREKIEELDRKRAS
jgi:hypothetical protein